MTIELQTDRLQKETGATNVGCTVHFHSRDRQQRLITITAGNEQTQTPQTIAYTWLAVNNWTPAVQAIDEQLEAGQLMGQSFQSHGFTVRQNRLLLQWLPLLSQRAAQLLGCRLGQWGQVECYEFWANDILYGIVIELKHPRRREAPARPAMGLSSASSRKKLRGVIKAMQLYGQCLKLLRQLR